MKRRSTEQWRAVLLACGVAPTTAQAWAPAFVAEVVDGAFSAGEAELDDFLGQVLHESRLLERVEEDLYYRTPGRLMAVWPSRFPTRESELGYLRNPQGLANKVYGGRMGNDLVGDGWRFRGRGLVMLTGRTNYAATGAAIGVDLVGNPDRMCVPQTALRASIRWWERTLPDSVMDNLIAVTKRVNGGTVGLDERGLLTQRAKRALEAA